MQLLKLHCCSALGQPMSWVDARLQQLQGLLPDLMGVATLSVMVQLDTAEASQL